MTKSREQMRPQYATALPPIALRYLHVRSLIEISFVILAALAVVLLLLPEAWRGLGAAAVLLSGIVGALVDLPIVNRIIIRNTSYEVVDDLVRIRRGVLVHRDLTISAVQILTVSIVDGPILRRYGLAKVHFTTIAHTDPLGPVTVAEAEALRRRILGDFDTESART